MSRRNFILVGALIIVAAAFFILSKITTPKTADTPKPTPTAQQQTTNPAPEPVEAVFPLNQAVMDNLSVQAKAEFDFAFSKAKEWREDSTPMAVIIKYSGSMAPKNGKNTYVFFAPSLSQYYFTVNIDQEKNDIGENNFERVIYYREDYFLPKNIAALPIKYWVTDYVTALQKADSLGGKTIRTANSKYDVNMFLYALEGQFLTWNIEYLVDGNKRFSVPMSSYDGTVMTR